MFLAPLISIITPVYNAERYLDETVRSVIAQTYSKWELLLVMDAKSSDGSLALAKKWQALDARIQVLESASNLGVANNRNSGIQKATGEYIAFLDSDDVWLPQKLERQVHFMKTGDYDFTCHSYSQMSANSSPLQVIRNCPEIITYSDLLKSNVIGCLTVMIRSSLLKQFSFANNLPHEDFLLWLEILNKIPQAFGLNENLARYRVLPDSRSGNKKQAALDRWHLYRQVLKLNIFKSLYFFGFYAINAVSQRWLPSK